MSENTAKPVARRAKGEQTRRCILEAAIKVLAKNGIKGTTHRAVAHEAQIQLSLTTYYFKDIKELVREAFVVHIQQQKVRLQSLWQDVHVIFDSYGKTALRKKTNRIEMCNRIAEVTADFIVKRNEEDPGGIAVDMVLFTEAQFSEELLTLAESYRQERLQPLEALCAVFVKHQPEVSARVVFNIVRQAEMERVSMPESALSKAQLVLMIRRVMISVVELHKQIVD